MTAVKLLSSMAFGVIALMVFAACGGSSNDIRSGVYATSDASTPAVVATGSSAADGATVDRGETNSPNFELATPDLDATGPSAINGSAEVEVQDRVIDCDTFVADVVPDDLGPNISRLPNQTLTDWVSYSDQFAIFTVLDEQEQSEYVIRSIRGGTYAFDRSVTARIEETIWTAMGTEAVEGDITMVVSGWSTNHGFGRYPAGGPGRIELGGRFMAPLVMYKYNAGNAWGVIELSALILDGEDVVGPLEQSGLTYMPVVGSRIGDTVDEVATALACTEREERAVKYSDLLPEARWHAVQDDIMQNTDSMTQSELDYLINS